MTTISSVGIGSTSQTTVGALTVGSLASGFTVVSGALGGTGVANTGKTITLGGNLVTSGAFNFTATLTADTNVTLPASGTLATTAQVIAAVDQTSGTVTVANNSIYSINNGASLVTLTIPATTVFGFRFTVVGMSSGLWKIQANTGQIVNIGSNATTTAGSVTSTNQYDSVTIFCTVANTTFVNVGSPQGTLTTAQDKNGNS